jgi:cytoplasmic iron level regulating protein YaaA (DUF328/UPF0246 family)
MIILLSPAKTIDTKPQTQIKKHTMPVLLERAEIIADIMKGFSTNRLMELMNISKSLASTNVERYREWTPEFTTENAKQAILTFTGEVFKSMNTKTFEQADFLYAQKSIRILSGLYGVLRPLDLIMPYRLEMGIHLANPAGSNLYAYWREVVTKSINNDLEETQSQALINLASDEYFKVIDTKLVTKPIITPTFLEYTGSKPRIVAIYAKKARGLMSAFAIKNNITNPEELKHFDKNRYNYSEEFSNGNTWAFVR